MAYLAPNFGGVWDMYRIGPLFLPLPKGHLLKNACLWNSFVFLTGTPPGDENGQISAVHPPSSSSSSSSEGTQSANGNASTGSSRTKRSNSEKGPRVRTVLSEQQLQTLRTVYASNPRPDALLKEHLVEITGLSPRVIRVWFQNKRCKDKKKAIQAEAMRLQQQQGGQKVTRLIPLPFLVHGAVSSPLSAQGIPPLTPQTPLTPDSMGQISPHHAFTYPAVGPPTSYDLPTTPTAPGVSPIVTYHQNPAWGSPTEATMSPFEAGGDFSSPMVSPATAESVGDAPEVIRRPFTDRLSQRCRRDV